MEDAGEKSEAGMSEAGMLAELAWGVFRGERRCLTRSPSSGSLIGWFRFGRGECDQVSGC